MVENTLEQMKSMLTPLKIYGQVSDTLIEAELKAYASGINLVKYKTYFLLSEGFATTANSVGLKVLEELLEIEPTGTVEQRRNKIMDSLLTIRGMWYLNKFYDSVLTSGFDGIIEECFNKNILAINFNNKTSATLENLSNAFGAIKNIAPAHLKINTNLPYKTFDEFDNLNKCFMTFDKLDLSFDSVENVS